MIRTVVHAPTSSSLAAGGPGGTQPPDRIPDKLLKYIPAEVLAFFVPAVSVVVPASGTSPSATGVWMVFLVGLAATVGYLYVRSDKQNPPRWYFYLLAGIAFVLWAIGTTQIERPLGIDFAPWLDQLALPIAILVVPLADELLSRVT